MIHSKRLRRCILLLIASGFILTACEQQQTNKAPTRIGIVLFGDSRQGQVDGFIQGMKSLGYESGKTVEFDIRNADNDRNKLKSLVSELLERKVDMLVAAGGLEADTMKHMVQDKSIPVIVLYVNSIIERGLVLNRRTPGWEVTGVDNLNAEISGKRVELMHELLPDAKNILILYYEKIAPSRIGVEKAKETAAKLGVNIVAKAVASREEIVMVMNEIHPGDVDAMLTVPTAPIDNALQEIILPRLKQLNLPLFTHSKPLAQLGALASYGAHFHDMGQQAARLADKIMRGVKASNIPFETPKRFVYTINQDVQSRLGLNLPELTKNQVNEMIHSK